jgi:site-specific DNA-methyltransferase (adenine-specific)
MTAHQETLELQDDAAGQSLPASPCALFLGDCLDVMKGIESGSVDMVCADLPYGTTSCKWDSVIPLNALWAEYKRVCKPTAAIVLTAMQPFTAALVTSNPKWFKYEWVWEKSQATGHLNAKKQPMRCHESVLVFYSKQCTYNPQKTQGHKPMSSGVRRSTHANECYGEINKVELPFGGNTDRYPRTIQRFSSDKQKLYAHPTQKPLALMEYMIRTYTNEGETVLDNTMGSGTTGVAAINEGRNFIGIEKDADFFCVANKRISSANKADSPSG